MIKIITDFDGACPHTDAGVKRLRSGQWVFYPGLRRELGLGEEIPGKGSRFSTRLLNTGKASEAVTLIVDWIRPPEPNITTWGLYAMKLIRNGR